MSDTLNAGQSLTVGQELRSNNGAFNLVLQQDGNLVLYQGAMPVWDTGTWNLPASQRPVVAAMQPDGNFALYGPSGNPIWATATAAHPGARLVLQDDRNLVLYAPGQPPGALWASNTVYNPSATIQSSKDDEVGYQKHMKTDATLFRDGTLVCSTFTRNNNWIGGLHGHVLIVISDAAHRAIWVSQDHACITRCSIPDVSCASWGQEVYTEKFPDAVGTYAQGLDIYQGDGAGFADLRAQTIKVIKAAEDIADEIKKLLGRLT